MTITESKLYDRLLYSFMGIRLIIYTLFFIMNLFQTIFEIKNLRNKKKETRFFVFFSLTLFCALRTIQTAFFYSNPNLGMGTLNFFFFTLGSAMIFVEWTFIVQFWLLIMYSLFVADDIGQFRTKPIRIMTYFFVSLVVVYQIIVSSITLEKNIETVDTVGFIILLIIFVSIIVFNGFVLIRHLKIHRKVTPMKHFDLMIFKTKILLTTIILVFVFIIIQEIIFNIYYTDTYQTSKQFLKLFVTGIIEFSQMVSVMLVLSNGHWSSYVLLNKAKINSESTTSSSDKIEKKPSKEFAFSGNTLSMGESVDC
ncbi:hypothetical protein ACTFIW_006936 [Dictyostelium discoideum]